MRDELQSLEAEGSLLVDQMIRIDSHTWLDTTVRPYSHFDGQVEQKETNDVKIYILDIFFGEGEPSDSRSHSY